MDHASVLEKEEAFPHRCSADATHPSQPQSNIRPYLHSSPALSLSLRLHVHASGESPPGDALTGRRAGLNAGPRLKMLPRILTRSASLAMLMLAFTGPFWLQVAFKLAETHYHL